MTEQTPEPSDLPETSPEPLRLDVPLYDYVSKGDDQPAREIRDNESGGRDE